MCAAKTWHLRARHIVLISAHDNAVANPSTDQSLLPSQARGKRQDIGILHGDHSLGTTAKIGLVSMSGTGYTAEFDYVRVSTVQP